MKTLIFFLSLFILIGCSENKQSDHKASNNNIVEKIKLKRFIKKIYNYRIDDPGIDNYGNDSSVMIFDKSGNIVDDRYKWSSNDSWNRTILSYDDKGNEIEYKHYKNWKKYYNSTDENLDDVSISEYKPKYDSRGNLIEHALFDNKGLLEYIYYYTYDSINQISSSSRLNEAGTITSKSIYENGKIVKEIDYDDKGKLSSTTVYEYDQAGNIMLYKSSWEIRYVYDSMEIRYVYDSNGNEIATSTKYENGETRKDSTFYNDKGEKTHTLIYDDSGKLTRKLTYEYFD